MKKTIFTIGLFFIVLALPAQAYYNPGTPTGQVNDYAGVMSESARQSLEFDLQKFEKETQHEIAVVTIESLQDDYIENFAEKLFQEWGIGKKGADNGVLFLIAVNDRKMRIEVGYGLEGALTDLQSKAILDQVAQPNFRNNDFDTGITASVAEIKRAIRGEPLSVQPTKSSKFSGSFGKVSLYLIFFLFIIWRGLAQSWAKSKRYWPGGVVGAGIGAFLAWVIFSTMLALGIGAVVVGLIGLITDYGASRKGWFKGGKGKGGGFFIFPGGGRGGGGFGGGFGGFGGGGSGGGGSSGGW